MLLRTEVPKNVEPARTIEGVAFLDPGLFTSIYLNHSTENTRESQESRQDQLPLAWGAGGLPCPPTSPGLALPCP